jgi:hypothetical protein
VIYTDEARFTREGVFNVHNNREALGQNDNSDGGHFEYLFYCKNRWPFFYLELPRIYFFFIWFRNKVCK